MTPRDVRRIASAMLPALLIGCTAAPMAPGRALAQSGTAPGDAATNDGPSSFALQDAPVGTRDDSQLMFQILIAELAGRRGELDIAMQGYALAAMSSDDPRVADRAARLAIFAQDWSRAESVLTRWSLLDPDNPEVHELRAQVLMRQGQAAQAVESFVVLIDSAADPDVALERIGALLQADPDVGVARKVAEGLADARQESAAARLIVAQLALVEGDNEAASAALEQALLLAPDDPGVILMNAHLAAIGGDFDSALQALDAAMERNPDELALRLGHAQLLVESGRTEEASAALLDLGKRSAGDGDALLSVALLSLEIDRTADARRWFEALLGTGEHADQANFQLGRLSDLAQDSSAAVAYYDVVAGGDLYLTAQLRVAELVAADGDIDQARQRVRALRDIVSDPMLQPRLVTTEGRLLQQAGQLDEAFEVLSEGLADFPGSSDILYARALVAEGAGKPELLEQDLGQLIEAEPGNAHALNALGYHYAERNERLDEASDYLEKAIALRPDDPAIMDSLGWLRFRQGDNEAATQLLERALALLPDPEIAAHLGEVLWNSGRQVDARAVWDKALDGAPSHEKLTATVERLTE